MEGLSLRDEGTLRLAPMSRLNEGFIYLIRTWSRTEQFFKIGWSRTPNLRIKDLRIGCPFPMEIVDVCAGTVEKERELHAFYAHRHVTGEWFALTVDEVNHLFDGQERTGVRNIPVTKPKSLQGGLKRQEPKIDDTGTGRPMRPGGGVNGEVLRLVAQRQDAGQETWLMEMCRQLNRNPGQVRPCIYRLLANGYLEAGESFSGRAVYRATAKGRAAISRPPES